MSTDFHVMVKEAERCIAAAQDRQRKYTNLKQQDIGFAVKDKVLLSTSNL